MTLQELINTCKNLRCHENLDEIKILNIEKDDIKGNSPNNEFGCCDSECGLIIVPPNMVSEELFDDMDEERYTLLEENRKYKDALNTILVNAEDALDT